MYRYIYMYFFRLSFMRWTYHFSWGHTSEEFTDFREYFPNTVLCKAIICNQWMAESNWYEQFSKTI